MIDGGEGVDVGKVDVFVDLVDGAVQGTKFDDFVAQGGDEAPVGGAAAGGGRAEPLRGMPSL